jgi:tripartite-type tricarboxylate transporter receptor subunit TctC
MKLPRRKFLHLTVGAAALPAASRVARAQAYPSRPVRIIVGFTAGSATDITASRTGRARPETSPPKRSCVRRRTAIRFSWSIQRTPSTRHSTTNSISISSATSSRSGASAASPSSWRNPSVPTKTLPEFIVYAKANPGKLNMASAGSGSTSHVSGELFKMMAGVSMVHVPYRGSTPALTDLLAGQVQVMFDATPSSLPHIRAGKLRPLAVTTTTRLELLPDIPTVGDFVPGYEASAWLGFGAPKNTPAAVVDRLNKEINLAIFDSAIKARLVDLGGLALPPSSPAEFGKLIADHTEKWARVIRRANIKPD